jgi:hypothetical protein
MRALLLGVGKRLSESGHKPVATVTKSFRITLHRLCMNGRQRINLYHVPICSSLQ